MLNGGIFADKKCVAVALSGGKDSVFLLHLLLLKRQELNICVKAINVEHGIRGETSARDSAFVKDLCKNWQVDLKTYCVNAPEYAQKHGLSLENGARVLRYECFYNAVKSGFCDCVATAHHQSDNAETLLLNFLRGTSAQGLSGIPEKSADGIILRPILNVKKSDIEAWIEKHGLPFVTDESNFSSDYTRNFLRNEVIPLIKQKFPAFEQSVVRFSQITKKENDFLNELCLPFIDNNSVILKNGINEVLFKRACLTVIKNMGFGVNYEKTHLDALWNLTTLETGSKINLKAPLIAFKSYDRIVFETQNQNPENLSVPFSLGVINFGNHTLFFEKCGAIAQLNDKNALYFDLDKLPQNCVLRFKQTGDKITAFGGVSKSLKKYFTDKKIESRISKNLPLIAKDNEIFAVLGIDISHKVKVDQNSANIIKFTFKIKEN